MRSFVRLLVLTSSCAVGLIPTGCPSINNRLFSESIAITKSPEALPVHVIRFEIAGEDGEGDSSGSDKAVVQNLKTKEREPFSQAEFDQDLKVLAKEFDKVEPVIRVSGNEVDITIRVWKKPFIRSFAITGNEAIETDKLMKEAGFQENTLLDRQAFYKGIQKIRSYYVKKGYFEVEITPEIQEVSPGIVSISINIHEGRAGFIEEIRFHNLSKEEESEIRDRMMTKEYSWWLSWLTSQGTYYSDVFRQDEMVILSYLQNKGFLDAKVTSTISTSKTEKNRIIIDIDVSRGKEYHLGTVSFYGDLKPFSEQVLLSKTGLKSGQAYSPDAIRYATRTLYDLYGSKGYIDTMVIPETKVVSGPAGDSEKTAEDRAYNVNFKIEQGKCYRVGLIRIIGNTRTDAKTIIHETLLVPGSIFDSTLLAKTEERLRNVGYFKSVNVYAVRSDQKDIDAVPFRDVHIEVEENPTTAQFSAFAGYNTTESISGGFNLYESNFKLEGIADLPEKGLRAVRGGGEYIGFNTTIGAKQTSYTLTWTKPYFLDSKWALGVDLQKLDNEFAASDYTIKSKQAVISLKRPLNAFVSFGTQYRLHDAHIDLKGIKNIRRNRELIRESKNGGTISALGVTLNYDSTNHPINPTTGIRSSLILEYSGLFGDHHFANLGYLNTLFFPITSNGILKVKGNIQLIKTMFRTSAETLPMDERLYLGGEGSIRGYRYNSVGPKFHDVNHTPRGGLTSLLLSGEYEHNLMKRLNGFVFVDGGNVWWRTLEFGNLRYSAGFGIKFYISENAPLTVGVGYPINPQRSQDVRRFFFSIGASF